MKIKGWIGQDENSACMNTAMDVLTEVMITTDLIIRPKSKV